MKRLQKILGVSAIATLLLTLSLIETPVSAQLRRTGEAIAQNIRRQPELKLNLTVEKRVLTTDATGKVVETWQSLNNGSAVQPGDLLRYRVSGMNESDRSIRNLVITQPIPTQMTYQLGSSSVAQAINTDITYSIDGGRTFMSNPTIQVTLADGSTQIQPAPTEIYTHIRWKFSNPVDARVTVNAAYQVQVR